MDECLGLASGQRHLFVRVPFRLVDHAILLFERARDLAKRVDDFNRWMDVLKTHVQHANAGAVRFESLVQHLRGESLGRVPPGGEQFVNRRAVHDRAQCGLGCHSDQFVRVDLAVEIVFRLLDVVMDHGGHLDHVLIARQHQDLVLPQLDPPVAVLDVPLVGRRLAEGSRFRGPESDFDRSNLLRLDAREPVDRPRQLDMKAGFAMGQHLAPEPLDHADFLGPDRECRR